MIQVESWFKSDSVFSEPKERSSEKLCSILDASVRHPFGIRVFFVYIRECNASHQSLRQLLKVYMFLGGLKPPLEQVRLRLHVHKLLSSLAFV